MYEFIAKFRNLETNSLITKKIDIDTIPLDAECMEGLSETQFAWKYAVSLALETVIDNLSLESIELLSC